jgi:hypothetical protein
MCTRCLYHNHQLLNETKGLPPLVLNNLTPSSKGRLWHPFNGILLCNTVQWEDSWLHALGVSHSFLHGSYIGHCVNMWTCVPSLSEQSVLFRRAGQQCCFICTHTIHTHTQTVKHHHFDTVASYCCSNYAHKTSKITSAPNQRGPVAAEQKIMLVATYYIITVQSNMEGLSI